MCGIIGLYDRQPVSTRLFEALHRIEYRGYDSAGIATIDKHRLRRRRAVGKLSALKSLLDADPISGMVGIGHTRWATHGKPSEANAHPHCDTNRTVAVVHNGIIENHGNLRRHLEADGVRFTSQTDSEIIAHLIARMIRNGATPEQALLTTADQLDGLFAIVVLVLLKPATKAEQSILMAASRGAPLTLGTTATHHAPAIGSDVAALFSLSDQVHHLRNGDHVIIDDNSVRIFDADGSKLTRAPQTLSLAAPLLDKGPYKHFMLKEIHEQPQALRRILNRYATPDLSSTQFPDLPFDPLRCDRLTLIACGSAYFASQIGKYWLESIAGMRVDVDVASEFRYRNIPQLGQTPALLISQSGETADTLAALHHCRDAGAATLALVNNEASAIARDCDRVLPLLAGPEISVASTKAFLCQISVLALLAVSIGRRRGCLDATAEANALSKIAALPAQLTALINHHSDYLAIARRISKANLVFYIGRNTLYPLAAEGALKLKELTYRPAFAYPGGELKHGPIALIDDSVTVIALAPYDALFSKISANIEEIRARDGKIILITDEAGQARYPHDDPQLIIPPGDALTTPILMTPILQLLAYHCAVLRGADVDQPRNLAKSVTVE